MSDRSELMGLIDSARYNPNAIQRAVLNQLERTYTGELEVIDPMNPFVFLTEAMATVAASQMHQAEVLNRRQYPQNALSFDELYHHMSDNDFIGRFDTPATVKMNLLLGKDEIIRRAVTIGSGNVRKVTIPRHTTFKVADTYFTMQYPIDIRVMGHGGLQIVYDGTQDSPLYSLESNKVEWSIENYNLEQQEFINIEIPVQQFRIDSFNASLNGTSSFKKTYQLVDRFYHCRAFMADRTGNWVEMSTTHSEQVFDPLKPTLQLKVIDDILQVSMPQVYYTTGLANSELRIDIYTTKGPMELPLQTYIPNSFTVRFIDYDKDDEGRFVAPLLAMTSLAPYSTDMVTGGTRGLTFEQLRDRVMRNTLGTNDIPITPAQISARLTDLGFSSVLNVDNITNRVYLATRALPIPKGGVSSGAGATMGTFSTTLDELAKHNSVVDNGERLTITPSMLYRNDNGIIHAMTNDEMVAMQTLSSDARLALINNNEYLYSPLHYVADVTENTFVTRPYYLSDPIIKSKHFIDDNDTAGVGVNSSIHALVRTAFGWKLVVKTDTDKTYKDLPDEKVFMQLAFRPVGETDMAYMNGVLVGRDTETLERIYEFDIYTNWDLDQNHNLTLTSFSMYEPVNRSYSTPLLTSFEILYGLTDHAPLGLVRGWVDEQLGDHLLPFDAIGIHHERITVVLGESLDGLWTRARAVMGSGDYLRYDADVMDVYLETVYERDEVGAKIIEVVDGSPRFAVRHHKGDPVLDVNGNPRVRFAKGEVVLDENRNPVPANERGVLRQMDLFMIDGVYYFATSQSDQEYVKSVPTTLVTWLKTHIRPLAAKVLEKTFLYLHPRSTVGYINVIIGDSQERRILAAQQLLVTFNVSQTVYKDNVLRSSIEQSSIDVIANLLTKPVIARDEILTMIKSVVGTDIIGVEISGLGGERNYTTLTVVDNSGRLCIGKRLVSNPDGTTLVQDDIQFIFVKHSSE